MEINFPSNKGANAIHRRKSAKYKKKVGKKLEKIKMNEKFGIFRQRKIGITGGLKKMLLEKEQMFLGEQVYVVYDIILQVYSL